MCAFYQLNSIMRRSFLLIFCLFCQASLSYAVVSDDKLIESALLQAKTLQLAEDETWFALLHYKRESLSLRFVSQVDDERFFLHHQGNTDAAAELGANIRAFFRATEPGHAQCLFPARWWWLKQRLELSDEFDVACPKLDEFMARISHDKLFLVFPSMYLNNPGSMFGHTFMRFDAREESILLSQTLNYAARVDQSDDFFSYISKGLFGGYSGFFRARAYYETVQEYNNIENRDIWEYQLAFSKDEITQLVRHIWEVKGIDFDYYFFRENCAYRLLALLDVIRPGMHLTTEGNFSFYAIPVDTVRALEDNGLLQSATFRASLATQIDDYFVAEDEQVSKIVLTIVAQDAPADKAFISEQVSLLASATKKLDVLEQSYNLLQFGGEAASPKGQIILTLINELSTLSPAPKTASKHRHIVSPEVGHDSMRVVAGYGEQNHLAYADLKFRPGFHDLLDAPQGYVAGAAINVLEVHLKWFKDDDLRLESLSVFNVTSLSPLSQWQKPLSWMFDFRLDRTQISDAESLRNFFSRGGVGFSLRRQAVVPFVMLMGEWNLSSDYVKGYSVLMGVQAGLHVQFKANQLVLSYQADDAVSGFEMDRKISQLQWQYNLQVNHALRLMYKRIEYDFYNDEDWSLNYNYYF
jgi:hypothetical protein